MKQNDLSLIESFDNEFKLISPKLVNPMFFPSVFYEEYVNYMDLLSSSALKDAIKNHEFTFIDVSELVGVSKLIDQVEFDYFRTFPSDNQEIGVMNKNNKDMCYLTYTPRFYDYNSDFVFASNYFIKGNVLIMKHYGIKANGTRDLSKLKPLLENIQKIFYFNLGKAGGLEINQYESGIDFMLEAIDEDNERLEFNDAIFNDDPKFWKFYDFCEDKDLSKLSNVYEAMSLIFKESSMFKEIKNLFEKLYNKSIEDNVNS